MTDIPDLGTVLSDPTLTRLAIKWTGDIDEVTEFMGFTPPYPCKPDIFVAAYSPLSEPHE